MKKELSIEQRYPTKHARDAADRAIDDLHVQLPMSVFIDKWLEIYFKSGGRETK